MPRRGPYRPGTYLGALRHRRGLTLADAARRLEVSRSYLNRVELGAARPSASLTGRIAALYRVREREVVRLLSLALHLARQRTFPEVRDSGA